MVEVDEDEVELEFVPPPPQDVITKIVKIKKRYFTSLSPKLPFISGSFFI